MYSLNTKLRAVDNVASCSVRVGAHARPPAGEEMSMLKSQSPAGETKISHQSPLIRTCWGCGGKEQSCKDQGRSKVDGTKCPHTVCKIFCCICKQDDPTFVAV